MKVLFLQFLFGLFTFAYSQSACTSVFTLPDDASILETDEKGWVVFNVTYCGATSWSMRIVSPPYITNEFLAWDMVDGGYELSINRTIDLEYFQQIIRVSSINITLQFHQNGVSAPKSLIIPVIPVNENAPTFTGRPFVASVPEGAELNSTVFDVRNKYSDEDAGDYITRMNTIPAKISEFDGTAYFHLINEIIVVAGKLDYEPLKEQSRPFYNLGLIIYDTGNKTATAEVKINVVDVDEPPVFVRSDCQRNTTDKLYPWNIPECPIHDYMMYISPNGKVTTVPDIITAIDFDLVDNKIGYYFLQDDLDIFGNESCTVAVNNETGIVSVPCNNTDEFDQFYLAFEGMDINISVQAIEVSSGELNATVPATVQFGPPPVESTTPVTVTTTTTVSTKTVAVTTKYKSTTTVTDKEESKNDTAQLLIIIIPSVAGGLLLIIIIIVICWVCRGCSEDPEREYHLKQKKLAQRAEYYAAYDNVDEKGEVNGLSDAKEATVVHHNEVYINPIMDKQSAEGSVKDGVEEAKD